jgi:hypothetical protein
VFFNTFEELTLPITGPMEDAGVVKLYEPSPTLCLYVAPVENMEGRVPRFRLILAGNSTPRITHIMMFSKRKNSGFPFGCADAAAAEVRRGSNVFEVSSWLWQFLAMKATPGWSDSEGYCAVTVERKNAGHDERLERGLENYWRFKADKT